MKSEYPHPRNANKNDEFIAPPPSRFIDEKISDDTDAEAKMDNALKPAGLKNPFWN